MAAIDFPDAPEVGDIHTSGDKSWVWTGITWDGVQIPTDSGGADVTLTWWLGA